MIRDILDMFSLNKNVLELGVGAGIITKLLLEKFRDVNVIDISEEMVKEILK